MPAVTGWQEVADRIWVRRYDPFDVNVSVVAGDHGVLLVDVRTSLREARELREHLDELPIGPITHLAYTHAHLDHCLGAGAFPGVTVWGSTGCREALVRHGIDQRERWLSWLPEEERPHLRASPIVPPDHTVRDRARVGLGGREVDLLYLGRGHTDHDLVVHAADVGVALVGDLLEVGAPPQFGDSYPFQWPSTLSGVAGLNAEVVVPGHGAVADAAAVTEQSSELAHLASLCREALGGVRTRESVFGGSPYPHEVTELALARAAATS
jgi:glyoxylase-like metal-dependent hydrolase (beta-lactamase superfamily II)